MKNFSPEAWITIIIMSIAITWYLCRWFLYDTHIKQQRTIIALLSLMAKSQGVSKEEINKALNIPDGRIEQE